MKIEVPNTLNDIPLKNYQKLLKLEEANEIDTIAILLGVSETIVRNLKAVSVTELNQHLSKLFDRQHNLQRHFKIDGKEFGFIPNLDDATWGEINDIETTIGKFDEMHRAMAVLYRPVTLKKKDKYLIEEYEPGKYNDLMKDAPLGAVMGANVFFYNLMKDLSKSTLSYMKEEVQLAKDKGILDENGESMDSYLTLLEGMSFDWNKHLN